MTEAHEPRPAATVIAAREGTAGTEVLVLRRGSGHRFLAGYVAFPGGAVDVEDRGHAARWFGSSVEEARACAVRELVEEVGLALTARGLRPGDLAAVEAAPPRAAQLAEVARWVAPEEVPVRFDARYFLVGAPRDLDPLADGHEAALAWWASPGELLEEWRAGRGKLYWPTYLTMTHLARCGSLEEMLALRFTTREPDEAELEELPRSTFWEDG